MKIKNQDKNLLQHLPNALIWGSILVFILLFLYVAYNNRLSQGDDMFFFAEVQEKGIIQSLVDFKFNTRYSSFLTFNLFFYFADGFSNAPIIIFIFHALFLLALMGSIYLFVREVMERIFYQKIDRTHVMHLSGLFLIILFFGAPQLIETWYWIIAVTVYGVPLIATLMGFYALLTKSKGFVNYFILVISFLVVGGALENLAIVNLLLLGLILLLSLKSNYFKPMRIKALTACFSILFLFIVNFLSGGNHSRMEMEIQSSTLLQTGFKEMVLSFFDSNNILVGICLLLILIKGVQLSSLGYKMRISITRKHYFYGGILFLIIGLITFVPLIYVFDGWGPERAWIPFHFFMYIAAFIMFLHIGYHTKLFSWFKLNVTQFVLSGMLLSLLLIICLKQFPKVRKHRIAYDTQIEKMENEIKNNRVEALKLDPSPPSGYVVMFTITPDTTNWNNLMMKRALKANFSVYMSDSLSIE